MNQSAQGKLKSKYQSSSRKIKELYHEFESLKSRINTPSKNKRPEFSFDNSDYEKSIVKTQSEQFSIHIPRFPTQKKFNLQTNKSVLDFQTKTFIKNTFQKFITSNILQLDNRVDKKCEILTDRMQNLNELLQQVGRLMKIKASNLKVAKNKQKCNCKWKGLEIKEVQEKYQGKIQEMRAAYENKISLLVKQNNAYETSASSNAKKVPKQMEEQLKNMEERLLIKQKEITELQLETSRLRRLSDNNNKLLRDKERLLEELGKQINQKESHIKEMNKNLLLKEKDMNFQKKEHEIILKKLNAEIDRLNILSQPPLCEILGKEDKKSENILLSPVLKQNTIDWNESQIENAEVALSDFEDQQDSNHFKLDDIDNYDLMRHSHFVNPSKKNSFHFQKKIQQLQSELQLISEENRLLKDKKDKFEVQVKENQSDEERFQMQSQILRQQLKRMNISLKNLDQCAVIYFKQKKVALEKIETLDESLNFKKQLVKKFPQRKNSISKSIK